MTGQLDLIDALARVEANADDEWLSDARDCVRLLATAQDTLTTDDVWDLLALRSSATHEPRALGAVMRWAVGEGLIVKTERMVPSKRSACHGRDIRVWRSVVRQKAEVA